MFNKIGRKIISKIRREEVREAPKLFYCNLCGKAANMLPLPMFYFDNLFKNRHIHNIFLSETLNISHYSCEHCGTSDRNRLYALYITNYFKNKKSINLLDIAPDKELATFIKNQSNVSYRSTDLYMPGVDDVQDVTNMHLYTDNQFDFFICSHVLEHIPDDRKAIAELFRILKPNGVGIVMVPIILGIEKTIEDPSITDEGLKWKYFGQNDHVRMYGKTDFIKRLEHAGFMVEQLGVDFFGKSAFEQMAIHPDSILYIVHK